MTARFFYAFLGLAVVSMVIHGGIATGDVRVHGHGLFSFVLSTFCLVGYPVKIRAQRPLRSLGKFVDSVNRDCVDTVTKSQREFH